jgi:hypothetical protein
MGLLDDAIREHLELKRLRGADPSAVARAEREALEPVFPDEADGELEYERDDALGVDQRAPVAAGSAPPSASEDGRLASFSALDQATAELDMRSVLDEDPDEGEAGGEPAAIGSIDAAGIPGPAGMPGPDAADTSRSDLDWGFPDEPHGASAPGDALGQERLSFE